MFKVTDEQSPFFIAFFNPNNPIIFRVIGNYGFTKFSRGSCEAVTVLRTVGSIHKFFAQKQKTGFDAGHLSCSKVSKPDAHAIICSFWINKNVQTNLFYFTREKEESIRTPLFLTFLYRNQQLTILPKSALSEAPPTRPPSMFGFANNSAAFPPFTEPPY